MNPSPKLQRKFRGKVDTDQSRENLATFPKLPNPLAEKRIKRKLTALQRKVAGKYSNEDKVAEVSEGQFARLTLEREEMIWNLLVEFPDLAHNQIPKPNRTEDNISIWVPDFNVSYYQKTLFATKGMSMTTFYKDQSNSLFSVDGVVEDWMSVDKGYAYYGNNDCDRVVCPSATELVEDSANVWYQSKIEAGWTVEQINDYLSQFDIRDRNDWDNDGDFMESDFYIDHIQIIHAGKAEEFGGGEQGTDALWSHRWYSNYSNFGKEGPTNGPKFGGVRIGQSDYWIGDYFMGTENGGLGLFVHEFAHDLDLPDLYNTKRDILKENGVNFWSVMSSGSYGSSGTAENGLDHLPLPFGPWEKLFMGWLDYEVIAYGEPANITLGASARKRNDYSKMVLLELPPKFVPSDVGPAYSGTYMFYSTTGDNVYASMSRVIVLSTTGTNELSAQVRYEIELDWDYAYFSINGAFIWTSESTENDPNAQNIYLVGITGNSKGWKKLTVDLSSWAGREVEIGFHYLTDMITSEKGLFVDDIAIDGILLDDAESGGNDWTIDGFIVTDRFVEKPFEQYYLAEYRSYKNLDSTLRTGPFNFQAFRYDKRTLIEHLPYQDGLLIWHWDTSFEDNNVAYHCDVEERCGGMILPIDSHPDVLYDPTGAISVTPPGTPYASSVCVYDATFSPQDTPVVSQYGFVFGGLPGVTTFDDVNGRYVDDTWPYYGAFPSKTGTKIEITEVDKKRRFMKITIN